jgi:predicted GNAT family N-acyltransferase
MQAQVWNALKHLEEVYPGFSEWYWGKVIPGLEDDSRRILTSSFNGTLIGVVIAKKKAKKKICTVWVAEKFRRASIARDLMAQSMEWLGTERPLFTVSDKRMLEFSSLISRFGFEKTAENKGLYVPGSTEHIFN